MTQDNHNVSRRNMIISAAGGAAAMLASGAAMAAEAPAADGPVVKNGRLNHSVCLWCYKGMKVTDMAPVAKQIGLKAIDLLGPKDFPVLKEHGLVCSMTSGVFGGIEVGLNRKENHEKIVATLKELIEANAEAGFPNVICFSGNRHKKVKQDDGSVKLIEKVEDEEGIKVCAEGLKQVMALAEQKKVTIQMELLNSRVNHPDYMCDKSEWGIKLCKAVGSENFKLLYDIYHMQIMEGDIMRTIKTNHQYFGHYHTGGNPGRNEIDETQELYWPAIMRQIVDVGFKGYVAQEFIPKNKDMIASLRKAVAICDV